jgi:competence protein ComEC
VAGRHGRTSLDLLYTIFTGAAPSVVRAAIMGTVLLLGPLLGRRYDPVAAIALSAAVMFLFDPDVLADPGFQFSFLALLGITFVSTLLLAFIERIRYRKVRVPALIAYPISATFGAVIGSAPMVALVTGWLSLVAPLATLSADFALPPLMIAGIATVILGSAGTAFALLPGLLVWPFAWWLLANSLFWSSLPWAGVDAGALSTTHVLLYYALLFAIVAALCEAMRRRIAQGQAQPARRPSIALPGTTFLALAAIVVWAIALFLLFAR